MATALDEDVDLSDLDLLDDERRHGQCRRCYPVPTGLGVPFTAWCGVRAVWLTPWTNHLQVPPDACEDCLQVKACATCGASRP